MDTDVVPGPVDPVAEPCPLGEQRLVRDLDGRAPRDGSRSKLKQAVATERVEHRAQQPAIDVEIFELAPEHSATGVLAALAERDEAEEHLPGDLVGLVAEAAQQAIGALDQRARDPAELLVGGVVDAVAAPAVEQLGQRVLQQRQRAGSIGHLPDQGRDAMPARTSRRALSRQCDRPLQLARGHRRDDLGPLAEQFAETAMLQRPVVEVGSKRGDDTEATAARR